MPVIRGLTTVAVLWLTVSAASAFELQGTTFCGGTRMVGATVQALFDATQQEAGTSTTDASGHYGLTLSGSTYDLVVTPPAGSTCLPATVQNKAVTGDETFDIILTPQDVPPPPPPDDIALAGTLRVDGVAMAGFVVTIWDTDTYNELNAVTDASGSYRFMVPPGRYEVSVYGAALAAPLPKYVSCYVQEQHYTSDSTETFELSTATVTGSTVTSPNPGVAANLGLSAQGSAQVDQSFCSGGSQGTTNALGQFGPLVILAGGNGSVSTQAVAGTYLTGSKSFTSPAAGGTIDVQITVPQVQSGSIGGTLTLADGTPLEDAYVSVFRLDGSGEYATTTDADGSYRIDLPFGTYEVSIERSDDASSVIPSYLSCWLYEVPVNADVTRSFTFRTGFASGLVRLKGSNIPVANKAVQVWASQSYGDGDCYASGSAVTNAQGEFGPVLVLGGTNGGASAQGVSEQYYSASASFFIPEGGTGYGTIDLPPYESYAVSGTMTGDEQPIVGMQVRLEGQAYRETQTDEAGAYSVVVPKGYYEIYLSKTGGSGLEEPANIYCERYDTYVSAPLDFGYAFTWHRVSGRVTNAAGVPIGGVTVNSSSWVDLGNDAYCYTYWSGQTADDGSYSFLAMQGQTSYSFVPKAGSGYKSINLSSNLTGDLTQQVVLQLPDIVSPNLLGDPVVIHHSNTSVSIQWGTNEATNGRLEYEEGATLDGAAVVIDKPAYVTDHIVTLRDLAPLTEYAYRVTSKDAAGNAVTSGILTFTTVELPDVEAPVITAGPTVTFLAPTQIRVSWQTNEPATSWIDYGLAGGARDLTKGGDESALLHDVLLTGLTPETTYSLVVRSSDPDGNGPTASAPFDVTTPAVSDTTAPTVTNLRTECVTHERMAVCWDTDEPATSNVAYENQSTQVAGGISSGALVTSRCMALTGLSAATSYRVSVSSADGGSNVGSGGPIFQTTGTDASDGAPVISGLVAEYTSPTAARVRWTTDAPASTFLRWGTSQALLDRTAGDVTASETTHEVILTGLAEGATIWVEASSTNPCLQQTTAGPLAVVDVDECGAGGPGCAAPGICVDLVGGHRCEHAPVIEGQGFTLAAEVAVGDPVGQVAASDADGEALALTIVARDDAGALALATDGALTVASASGVAARAGGTFTLTVRATDPGGRFAEATITVSVSPAEDVDGCLVDNGGCDQLCADLPDGVACDCEEGFALSTDGTTCLEVGECGAGVSCDPAAGPMVFFGAVTRDGDTVGSVRCTREVDGDIHCDVDEHGVLVVSDVLWCAP